MSSDAELHLRSLPAVHVLVDGVAGDARLEGAQRVHVVDAAREVLDRVRRAVLAADASAGVPGVDELVTMTIAESARMARGPLGRAINATGILLHTGLGRAPMADAAVEAARDAARGYVAVELDLESGKRGRRSDIVRELLCRVTGAESATVVNNNAAAMVIVLAAMAHGRAVVVSRGELVEIGGSFRLPDVMAAGGATLREVGTTNRTRISDYERAIGPDVAALMKVHPSNYRIEGFTTEVSIEKLVEIGRRHGVPVVHDVGSGLLTPRAHGPLAQGEPDVATSIAAGADIVAFSGDKLLGGPQAGILVGRAEWIRRIEAHPLMRAMRLDKIRLAALAATLDLHRDPATAEQSIPALAMSLVPAEVLMKRANAIAEPVQALDGVTAEAVETTAYLGGGSIPARAIASAAVALVIDGVSSADVAQRLRLGAPAVVPRVHKGTVLLDLRSVLPAEDALIVAGLREVVASLSTGR